MRIELPRTTVNVNQTSPTQLIAEIGLNHNGNFEFAKELIKQSVLSGAQLVKLQKRSPSDLTSQSSLDSEFLKCPGLGSTQRELRTLHEFNRDQFRELIDYAALFNACLFTSCFDIPSFEFTQTLGIKLIKVASHSLTNKPLLEKIASTDCNVIISNGASSLDETRLALSLLNPEKTVLMHCVSSYPTSPDSAYLETIPFLMSEFPDIPIGYSSHEIGIDLSLAASALGASLIERHITLSNSLQGFDHKISLLPSEFSDLSLKLARISEARFGIRDNILPSELPVRKNYHVGIYSKNDLPVNHLISLDDLLFIQPANNPDIYLTGLEADSIIGKRISFPISKNTQLKRSDFS